MFWLSLSAVIALDLLGISFAKSAAQTGNPWHIAGAIGSFALVGLLFVVVMQYRDLAIANALWSGVSTAASIAIAVLYFHEKISVAQFGGIALILSGVIILQFA